MDLLVVETLEADVLEWLGLRHSIRHAPIWRTRRASSAGPAQRPGDDRPGLGDDRRRDPGFRARAAGDRRVSAGAENLDVAACERRRIEVVRSLTASARAEAEFAIGAVLSLLRRVPVRNADGSVTGRELGGATVGLVGMTPTARSIAQLLSGFGARVIGYDPALHASDSIWQLWKVQPVGLRELFERSDVVSVQLTYFSRYHGLLGDRFLTHCKPSQVLVSTAHSGLFDETALAAALKGGRIAAAWFDSLEPGALDPSARCGIQTLQVTPRVAAITARRASAAPGRWPAIDELLESCRAPASSPRRRFQAGSLISKPRHGRTELGDPLLELSHHLGRRLGDEALVAELGVLLAISASMRSISLVSRAISAARSISTCSAIRFAPTTATGESAVAAAKSASSNTLTSDTWARAFRSGVAAPRKPTSPVA
jgi:phosphoglycerate dehydrogenase-like enzyme